MNETAEARLTQRLRSPVQLMISFTKPGIVFQQRPQGVGTEDIDQGPVVQTVGGKPAPDEGRK